jgi:transcriptional regulator with XRE-family HTH domain
MAKEAQSNGARVLPPPGEIRTSSVDEHIGSRIRTRRRLLGLTQEDLANQVGVTAQQVHKYENGSNRVAASKLFEIATALSLPISAFFEGLPEPAGDAPAPEDRAKNRLLLDKEILELAMSFDEIEEARLRRVVLRIIKAAAAESHKIGD